MENKSQTIKKKNKGESTLLDFVFSWSVRDVLNKNLYKDKVNQISDKFSSTTDYLNSFKQPLIEETRAELCSGLESVAHAPACEISSISIAKKLYKPPKDLYYVICTKEIRDIENHDAGHYEPESGDLIALTNVRPRRIEDLVRPGDPLLIALVTKTNEGGLPRIQIFSSREIRPELEIMRHERLFATCLMNMTTNMRIWRALHADPRNPNMGLIQSVLNHDSSEDNGYCSVCPSQERSKIGGLEVSDLLHSFRLDESQKNAVMSSISMRNCPHQNHNVKLIWGPPGTGKTKTVACLLFVLLKLKCRTLTCAPTNVAVVQVAKRLVRLFLETRGYDAYGLGDIVLFGNEERMKIQDHDDLEDVFLKYRCDILTECLKPFSGWRCTLASMISLLEDPQEQYKAYLRKNKRSDVDKDGDKNNAQNDDRSASSTNLGGSRKDYGKQWREVIKKSLIESEKENRKTATTRCNLHDKGDDCANKEIETEDLMTYDEFVRKTFYSLADRLTFCAENLYTHLPTSLLPLYLAKVMIRVVDLLKTFEKARKRIGSFPELTMKRKEILGILKPLNSLFPDLSSVSNLEFLCLSNARLIFCTASSSIRVWHKVEMVIIDESAQLKECESAIPLLIPGLRNVVLVGDDRQLPAMVRSKYSEDANFGRSLFQRLSILGKKKHLLNIQYRMHPSISLFPNRMFYENKIVDAANVKEKSYEMTFLERGMYGSYSFINVADGKENFSKGHSPSNAKEAAVVDRIIAMLFKQHCITKKMVSVGVISPYKGQMALLEERLGMKYYSHKQNGFSVSVRTVDGFQGGEEDLIIISTVRCNTNGSVGFLSDHQRTNVALTRARYCLWIVGSGATLANSGTVWQELVIDAKTRGCFYDADAIMSQSDGKLDLDSLKLRNSTWKVFFSDQFKISAASIKSSELQNQVMKILKKLADGWHQSNSESKANVAICGVASELLELYKVNERFFLAWSVDILKEESKYTQVVKVWDLLPALKVPGLANELGVLFGSYTVDFMNRCRSKIFEGELVVPMSWPLHGVFSACPVAHLAGCLSDQLASVSLEEEPGDSSSSTTRNNAKSKLRRRGGGASVTWVQKRTMN